jgi:hypothetical protein
MPDGSRKRRCSTNLAKRRWYARYRSLRFNRRFGLGDASTLNSCRDRSTRESVDCAR